MASEKQPTLTFEGWRYSRYFKLVETKGVNVRCPGQKHLSTAVYSTVNLTKHLKGKHANMKLVAQDPRGSDMLIPSPNKQLKRNLHQVSKQELYM